MFQRWVPALLGSCLLIAACGGGDDDSDTTTTTPTTEVAAATTTIATTTTTPTPTTTEAPPLVTEGATVIVANASIVGGSAGRMTDELASNGFTTGEATNAAEGVDLDDSTVHFVAGDADAEAVANSLAAALGGVEVSEVPDPIPTETGELAGQVLLLLGTNQADRTLDELSGAEAIVTSGTTVVVANTSGVGGSAGRMTTQLERAGFTMGDATNGLEIRADSIVYYGEADGAQADAELLAEAMGGLEVEPLPDPIPTEDGELAGDVLLLLGTNQADRTLGQLNP